MQNLDLLPSLLTKITENQHALEAALMELANWAKKSGSPEVAENVRGALATLELNEEFIKMSLAVMSSPD